MFKLKINWEKFDEGVENTFSTIAIGACLAIIFIFIPLCFICAFFPSIWPCHYIGF
jgi:hypothetical protein